MEVRQRRNLLFGVIPVVVAGFLLLQAVDYIPSGINDLITRAWPVLLVLLGLSWLLRDRGAIGSLLAVILSAVLVGGVTFAAYSSRATQPRTDQQQPVAQDISGRITLLAVNVEVRDTDIEIISRDDNRITGEFVGSTSSEIGVEYVEQEDGTAEFRLVEHKPEQFPLLEAVGRGTLRLELPADLATAVAIAADNSSATLNLSDLALERLNLAVQSGDVLVTLPDYSPRSPSAAEQPGTLASNNGDITIFVPPTVSARLELNRGGNDTRPQFDASYILIDDGADGTLEKRNFLDTDTPLYYEVTAPRGIIRLEISSTG